MAKDTLKLTTLADEHASVSVGWVAQGVLYARLSGNLTARLGEEYARQLERLVKREPHLRFFSDASAVKQYDLAARSAFVRVVLAQRRRFTSLVMLTWAEGISRAAHALVDTFGDGAQVLTEKSEFDTKLFTAAPGAHALMKPFGQPRSIQ